MVTPADDGRTTTGGTDDVREQAPPVDDSSGDASAPTRGDAGADGDGPDLEALAHAAVADAPRKPEPRIPPAPKVPPPPTLRTSTKPRSGVTVDFDLGDGPGPVALHRLTSGPARSAHSSDRVVDEEAATLANEEAGAADALLAEANEVQPEARDEVDASDADQAPAGAESSGRSGPPKLPMPGMLGKRSPADFRDARRPAKAPMGPGVIPPGGVMPPGAVESRLEPEDTDVLINVVAAELMEPDVEDEPEGTAVASSASLVGPGPAAPPARAAGSRVDASQSKPLWIYAAAAAALVIVSVWAMSGGSDDASPPNAAKNARAEMAAVEAAPQPKPSEPVAPDEPPEAVAVPAEAAAETGDLMELAAETGDVAIGTGEAPAVADTGGATGADTDGAGEAVDEPTDEAAVDGTASAPAKHASKSKSSTRKRARKDDASDQGSQSAASSSATPPPSGDDDPKALLAEAKKALQSGNGSRAYALASKSNKLAYDTDAIEVMAIASCLKNDPNRAKSLLKKVPLFRRPNVRNRCKSAGIKLGL